MRADTGKTRTDQIVEAQTREYDFENLNMMLDRTYQLQACEPAKGLLQ